jgi:hypothetical protein
MSEIVQFPGAEPPPGGYSEEYIDKLHSNAFRDLETSLRDCVRMREIAAERTINARIDDNPLRFAIMHLADMLIALEKEYDARWHGEVRG